MDKYLMYPLQDANRPIQLTGEGHFGPDSATVAHIVAVPGPADEHDAGKAGRQACGGSDIIVVAESGSLRAKPQGATWNPQNSIMAARPACQ